ncbi:MAG: radical SAM protein [Pseudomonadota bacterium]|nr:radical SAM protein [Pseudomonadota bacterium]
MKVLFVYPSFDRHAGSNPELLEFVPMNEYLGSPSLGIASLAACTPPDWEIEYRDDRLAPADGPTDADLVALSFFTPAATRGMALADHFRAMGKQVVAGGIFPTMMPDVVAPHVDAVVVGEGEGVWAQVLADAAAKRLQPRYRSGPIDLSTVPLPRVDLYFGTGADDYPLQVSRGCGMTCSACALPTVMDPHVRTFPLEHVVGQLDQLTRAGAKGCLTEDTGWFPGAAHRRMSELFDTVLERGSTAAISYAGISMPMILATSMTFLAKAKSAGVDMFYLVGGFDPVTMKAFNGDAKALTRAQTAIAKCHDAGIEPYTSFLIGLDDDDEGTADRMLEFANRAQIRKAEFAVFTPYPGTPSWHRLVAQDRILHRNWSRYNDANVVFRPAKMSPDALHGAYISLWREFYAGRGHLADLPIGERTIQF